MHKRIFVLVAIAILAAAAPATAGPIVTNFPINGEINAYLINFGASVSDSFTLTYSPTNLTGMNFGAWEFPGDTMTSVSWAIGTTPFAANEGSGTAAVSQTFLFTNLQGFDVDLINFPLPALLLNAGTHYITLQNAVIDSGDPAEWDENDASAMSGFSSVSGQIGAESFELTGTTPEPGTLALLASGLLVAALRPKIR
jgi:hypothetical protein